MADTYTLQAADYAPHAPLDVAAILATTGPVYSRWGETIASTGALRPLPPVTRRELGAK